MSSKKSELYAAIFKYFKQRYGIKPSKVMSDYEASLRKAIKKIWKNAEVLGCYFHFIQAIQRKAKSISELSSLIRDDANAFKIFRLFMRLPLLPEKYIEKGLSAIILYQNQHGMHQKFLAFNEYFRSTWMTKLRSYSEETMRTNNITESFNAKLKRKIKRNPSTFSFLSK